MLHHCCVDFEDRVHLFVPIRFFGRTVFEAKTLRPTQTFFFLTSVHESGAERSLLLTSSCVFVYSGPGTWLSSRSRAKKQACSPLRTWTPPRTMTHTATSGKSHTHTHTTNTLLCIACCLSRLFLPYTPSVSCARSWVTARGDLFSQHLFCAFVSAGFDVNNGQICTQMHTKWLWTEICLFTYRPGEKIYKSQGLYE